MIESIFNENINYQKKVLKYNELRNNIKFSLKHSNEDIEIDDLIQYNGDYLRKRGIIESRITRCTNILSNNNTQLKRIYYKRIDNNNIDWLNDFYFKKIKTEKIDNTLDCNDFIISLEKIDGARDIYEIFPIYEIKRRSDNSIESIVYLNSNNGIRRSSCNKYGENKGFLKIFTIFNHDNCIDFINQFDKNNSYINIIKNLVN